LHTRPSSAGRSTKGRPASPSREPLSPTLFRSSERGDEDDLGVLPENNARINRRRGLPVTVIVGNQPYSLGKGVIAGRRFVANGGWINSNAFDATWLS
jgi:predicted helicase